MAVAAQSRHEKLIRRPVASALKSDLLLAGVLLLILIAAYLLTLHPVQVTLDSVPSTVWTHRRAESGLLRDLGLGDASGARVLPTVAEEASVLTIDRARQVEIHVDGRILTQESWSVAVAEIVAEAGLSLHPADLLWLNGVAVDQEAELPRVAERATQGRAFAGRQWNLAPTTPAKLVVQRALPIVVEDGGIPFAMRTASRTVGAALREAAIPIYLGDRIEPRSGVNISSGMRIRIDRSVPVRLNVEGRRLRTRTRAKTVADVLAELNIGLSGMDKVSPAAETPLVQNIVVDVMRVTEEIEIKEKIASYETIFEPDQNLLIDTQQVVNAGAEGITRSRTRVRYEDGHEKFRILEDTWVAQDPATRVIAYGQKIVPNRVTLDDGAEITYWRKIRMRASSYSANTAGVSPSAPWYGKTYTGDTMRFGIVAVDPVVIPLQTNVYVPGYGYGDALDTGSAIRARRIDLGYDDNNLVLWNQWVDVYLLWPPPPDYQITWVLPNWPLP